MIQAANPNATVEKIEYLTQHPDYDLTTPNRIRAVSGGLSNNPENTWGFGVAHFINLAEYLTRKPDFRFTLITGVISLVYACRTSAHSSATGFTSIAA